MSDKERIPFSMWKTALLIGQQSFLFGYCFSALNACLTTGDDNDGSHCYDGTDNTCPPGTIYNDINLSTVEAQLATALIVVGGWIGCMCGSYPAESKGRRTTLLANNFFFMAGAVLAAIGNSYCLFIGRFVSGLGLGFSSVVPPILLSELASQDTRGVITTVHQLLLTLGILIVSIIGYGFVTYVDHGWQYVQAFSAIPALIMLVFKDSVPESPKWLLNQSDSNTPVSAIKPQVVAILKNLRPEGHPIDGEIQVIMDEAKQDAALSGASWEEVFKCKTAVMIGCGLMFFQAATGINSVVFYSTSIFQLAGFDQSIIGTACFGVVNFLMTIVSAKLVDGSGRKILLLSGTYSMLVSLLVLSIVLLSPIDAQIQGYIAVLAVLTFTAGFAIGLGAVSWTVMSEIMPTRLRAKAMSLFLSVNWGLNLVIAMVTLTAVDGIGGVTSDMDDDEKSNAEKTGVGGLYLIFAGLTAACLFFIHVFVPETKGKTPEDLLNMSSPLLSPVEDM